jgi:pimeloyl-ACP methyl ester carboxylesterase
MQAASLENEKDLSKKNGKIVLGKTMPFVENQGVRIHYEIEGHGAPVMLMHGFSTDSRTWYQMGYVKELSKEYELILIDARGHGASDKPHTPEAYGLGLMISDLVTILDQRRISKASFFGYSMGGRIGFRIPLYASNRFSSLILGGAIYQSMATRTRKTKSSPAYTWR